MLIAAFGTFLSKRIILQLSMSIGVNLVIVFAVILRRPYLPVGSSPPQEQKNCKAVCSWNFLGRNNTLEVLLLVGEIFLWSAGLGNSIVKRETTALAVVEWSGLACFLFGFISGVVEILRLYVFSKCKGRSDEEGVHSGAAKGGS